MGFIYQEANAYGVEALVALERHYTPTEEKYCTAVTEAVRICDTYGIPDGPAGIVMSIDNVIALFLLPLFGALSDKVRRRSHLLKKIKST